MQKPLRSVCNMKIYKKYLNAFDKAFPKKIDRFYAICSRISGGYIIYELNKLEALKTVNSKHEAEQLLKLLNK
jgi:hypothetical protein